MSDGTCSTAKNYNLHDVVENDVDGRISPTGGPLCYPAV